MMTFSHERSCLRLLTSRSVLWLIESLLQLMQQRIYPPNTQEILHIPIAAARMDHSSRLFSAKIHMILLLRTLHPVTSMLCRGQPLLRGSRGKGFFAFLDLHIRRAASKDGGVGTEEVALHLFSKSCNCSHRSCAQLARAALRFQLYI
jgi:hypothetical protein